MVFQAAGPLEHGGDVSQGRRRFPDAPRPFVDLSTGINPYSYPLPPLSPTLFAQLPQADALARLVAVAADAYGAPAPACIVAAPGTQSLLPLVAALTRPGTAAILGPTYAEHGRTAALAGHRVIETPDLDVLRAADLAIVVNPNNPTGRVVDRGDLLALAEDLSARGGLLVIDEAFMDALPVVHSRASGNPAARTPGSPPARGRTEQAPVNQSLAPDVGRGNIVVLRSFGKFFGLAGLRLGFAIAAPDIATRLRASLGPWAVSGPALAVGARALADRAWVTAMQGSLIAAAGRLDALLTGAGLDIVGGTTLFRLVRTPDAENLFDRLGRAGILVRRFAEYPDWLRFGLPGVEPEWQRLSSFLRSFPRKAGIQQ